MDIEFPKMSLRRKMTTEEKTRMGCSGKLVDNKMMCNMKLHFKNRVTEELMALDVDNFCETPEGYDHGSDYLVLGS